MHSKQIALVVVLVLFIIYHSNRQTFTCCKRVFHQNFIVVCQLFVCFFFLLCFVAFICHIYNVFFLVLFTFIHLFIFMSAMQISVGFFFSCKRPKLSVLCRNGILTVQKIIFFLQKFVYPISKILYFYMMDET